MRHYLILCLGLWACGEVDAELSNGAAAHSEEQDTKLADSAWNVSLETTLVSVEGEGTESLFKCPTIPMTLQVTRKNAEFAAILGGPGVVIPGRLTETGQEYTSVEAMEAPRVSSCEVVDARIETMAFRALDADGDGRADRLSGSGMGYARLGGNDIVFGATFSFVLSGTPDETPPTWVEPGELKPLDVLSVSTSEPVTMTSRVVLEGEPRIELLPVRDLNGVVAAFESEIIVPFSTEWTLTGNGRDLARLPLHGLTVRSLPDPGIFAEDGFEGDSFNALIEGKGEVISAVGNLAALSGNKSLYLDPRVPVTFHLKRPEGASSVRFLARALGQHESFTEGWMARVGVIGGVERSPQREVVELEPAKATGDSKWPAAGPLKEYTYALGEEGNDVVLRLWTFVSVPSGVGPQGLLVDDVRVE